MSVITELGVDLSTIEDITKENTSLYQEFTGDIDVAASSAGGELIAITSEMQTRNDQYVADAFTQNTITNATDQNLDNIAAIKNNERLSNQPTIVYCEVTGIDTTILPEGTELTSAFNGESFFTEYEVVIAGTTAFVSAASVTIGVECPVSTISLTAPITGITNVTNNTPGVVGFVIESDTSLRNKLSTIGTPFTINLKEGLFLALKNVPNVVKVKILDNNTLSPIDGVPGKNFSAVILGGNNANIAAVIFKYMGVGNPSYGDVQQLHKSIITGDTYPVAFNRPVELLTIVAVTIGTNSDFNTSTGPEEIKNNIVAYFSSLAIGEDLLTQKIEAVCFITGIESADVTTDGTTVNKFSTFKEIFVTNLTQITVV